MYSFTSKVRFSETDETGYLSLINLMNYLQDCCLFHSESLGVGPSNLKKRHRLWLLSGWQIIIDRYPKMFEKITVETIPYAFKGCIGWRNAAILDEDGIFIVRANSSWVYLNTDTGKPEHPDQKEMETYGTEERIPMEYAPRKIKLPENMKSGKPIPVLQDYIDTNHHVNNARYVEIALGLIKKSYPEYESAFEIDTDGTLSVNEDTVQISEPYIKEIRVEYKKQAQLGDLLYPEFDKKDDWLYVSLEDEEEHPYASVALRI
ncbi:MAG: acyl-[acyl-carrier-protein] thioesterase [Clostridiales bacterium]|nr:acyl-[acyl-carrier-protein] thioesterase [Clostridiales bacterium]